MGDFASSLYHMMRTSSSWASGGTEMSQGSKAVSPDWYIKLLPTGKVKIKLDIFKASFFSSCSSIPLCAVTINFFPPFFSPDLFPLFLSALLCPHRPRQGCPGKAVIEGAPELPATLQHDRDVPEWRPISPEQAEKFLHEVTQV